MGKLFHQYIVSCWKWSLLFFSTFTYSFPSCLLFHKYDYIELKIQNTSTYSFLTYIQSNGQPITKLFWCLNDSLFNIHLKISIPDFQKFCNFRKKEKVEIICQAGIFVLYDLCVDKYTFNKLFIFLKSGVHTPLEHSFDLIYNARRLCYFLCKMSESSLLLTVFFI